jgi:hypothetical protein
MSDATQAPAAKPEEQRYLSPEARKARREYYSAWRHRLRSAHFAGVTEPHEIGRAMRQAAREVQWS